MAQLVSFSSQFMLPVFLIHIASLMSLPVFSDSQSITLTFAQKSVPMKSSSVQLKCQLIFVVFEWF